MQVLYPSKISLYKLGHVFLWCDIPTVPLQYTIGAQIFPINAQIHCSNYINGSYMFQLHSSHHQAVYVRSIRGNFIAVAYISLKLISGRYFGLTYRYT